MVNRDGLVFQIAKAFTGEQRVEPAKLPDDVRERADEALTRVELYLGVDVEQAREILDRVLEDVS